MSQPGNHRALTALHPRLTEALGQTTEFLVWASLIEQSRGWLHVFLPLLDRGLDAVIHRLTDGEYISVQVKSRTEVVNGFVEIGIPSHGLVDDRALIIAGLLTADGLGPMLLVVDQGTFRRVAAHSLVHGEEVYTASFSMDSQRSHWRPYLVRREQLAERLMGPTASLPSRWLEDDLGRAPTDDYSRWLGFLGESEVIRQLALNLELCLFRPFPDIETVEVLVRQNLTGHFLGLQVKAGAPAHYGEAPISIRKVSFEPATTTYLVALAWLPEDRRFADECLVIPTERVIELAVDQGPHWVLNFHPHSQERGRLDPYRRPVSALGSRVGDLLA